MSRIDNVKRPERPQQLNEFSAAILVAQREVLSQVRSKAFIISAAVIVVGALASVVIGAIFSGNSDSDKAKIAVVAEQAEQFKGAPGFEIVEAADEAEVRKLVLNDKVEAGLIEDSSKGNLLGVKLVAHTEQPNEIVSMMSVAPPVEVLEPPDNNGVSMGMRYMISFAFGLIFMMTSMTFGSTIAQNTVQEKQSRVVEILLSSVSARALLAGKVLGNSLLAFIQVFAIAAVVILGLSVTGQGEVLGLIGAPTAWFVIFFIVGFVMIAAIFAASASLVSRIEDTGAVLTPVMMIVMVPYMAVIFFNDNALIMTIMSYIPFSAPVGMPVRLAMGEALWWEPLLSLVILVVTTLLVIILGAKIYERSVLQTGARLKLREVLADKV